MVFMIRLRSGTDIFAPASGIAFIPDCDPVSRSTDWTSATPGLAVASCSRSTPVALQRRNSILQAIALSFKFFND